MIDQRHDQPDAPQPELDLDTLLGHAFGEEYGAVEDRIGSTGAPALELPESEPVPESDGGEATGKYRVTEELGHGGMGRVLRGHDADLGRDVAVKVLLDRHAEDAQAVQRFVEEARIGGQLEHPGIVPVYELGTDKHGRPFFSMKLVQGRTLAELLNERQAQGHHRLVKIFEHVCQAVAFAHARRVVHRDLKPSNVMVGAFGEVQVMDWGLAKVLDGGGPPAREGVDTLPFVGLHRAADGGSDRAHSTTGSVFGTPSYMSPEQARGEVEDLDERTDVFALGAILCEILTGQPPYVAESSSATRMLASAAELGQARQRLDRCGVDAELADIAQRCLQVAPDARPQDATALAHLVSTYLSGVEERAQKAEVRAASEAARAASEAERARTERRAKRLTLALAFVVLAAAAGWWWSETARQDRVERAERVVDTTLDEAGKLWREAKASPPGDLAPWKTAIAAAHRARTIAETTEVRPEIAERARRLDSSMQAELVAAQALAAEIAKDLETVHSLDELRIGAPGFDSSRLKRNSKTYAKVLRDAGIDVHELSNDEVIRRIRASRIADRLTSALDEWATLIPTSPGKAVGLDPHFGDRLRELADRAELKPIRVTLRQAGRSGDSSALIDLVPQLKSERGDLETMYLWARMFEACGDTEGARTVLEQIQIRKCGDFHANFRLGLMAYHAKPPRLAAACRYLASAVAVRPTSELARFWFVAALWQQGDREQARFALKRLAYLCGPSPDYPLHLAFELMQRHRLDDAKSLIDEIHKSGRQSCLSWRILGLIHKEQDGFAAAEKALRQALVAHDSDGGSHGRAHHLHDLAFTLSKLDRLEEAAVHFEEAAGLMPHWSDPRANMVSAMKRLGRYLDCLRWSAATLEIDPENKDTLFIRARVELEIGDLAAALKSFEVGLAIAKRRGMVPIDHTLHIEYATALRRKGRLDDCLEELDDVKPHVTGSGGLRDAFEKELRLCQRARALSEEFAAYVDGSKKPAADEVEALGDLCLARGEFEAAARVFWPEGGRMHWVHEIERHIYLNALAGTRSNSVRSPIYRNRALVALKARLGDLEDPEYLKTPKGQRNARRYMERWLLDPRLAGVRDAVEIAKLPKDEQENFGNFWKRIGAFRRRLAKE